MALINRHTIISLEPTSRLFLYLHLLSIFFCFVFLPLQTFRSLRVDAVKAVVKRQIFPKLTQINDHAGEITEREHGSRKEQSGTWIFL